MKGIIKWSNEVAPIIYWDVSIGIDINSMFIEQESNFINYIIMISEHGAIWVIEAKGAKIEDRLTEWANGSNWFHRLGEWFKFDKFTYNGIEVIWGDINGVNGIKYEYIMIIECKRIRF